MIYITGDTHGDIDIRKLSNDCFKAYKEDYLIIAGDFGLVWDNSKREKYWLDWLNEKPYTILFVDGNHENFDMLNSFEIERWNGGCIHKIRSNIYHLMRGHIFTIEGLKIFAMGGATSIDKDTRVEGISWWNQEQPTTSEMMFASENLESHQNKVDYVISHTTSFLMMSLIGWMRERSMLNQYFEKLESTIDFKHWYFGHFHLDRRLDNRHTSVYDNIMPITDHEICPKD